MQEIETERAPQDGNSLQSSVYPPLTAEDIFHFLLTIAGFKYIIIYVI